jgi:hypothetical protein
VAGGASVFAAEGRTIAAGDPAGATAKLPAPAMAVLLPSEKPMAKKNAQTSTKTKKMASMRPVPIVISVSCCAVDMGTSLARYFPAAGAPGAGTAASSFCMPEKKSIGTGNTTVVFFSTPISVSVCR